MNVGRPFKDVQESSWNVEQSSEHWVEGSLKISWRRQ